MKSIAKTKLNKSIFAYNIVDMYKSNCYSNLQEYLQTKKGMQIDEITQEKDTFIKERNKHYNKFRSYSTKLPTLIKVNGLIATLAFIKGKIKTINEENKVKDIQEYEVLYNSINQWYKKVYSYNCKDILNDIIKINNRNYTRAVTIELLSLLVWIKRFAKSEL